VGSAKDIWNSPVLTPNGRFVAFDCTDSDIVAGDNNRFCDVFLRDLMADTTELISVRDPGLPNLTPGGASGSSPIDSGRFSSPLFLYGRPNGLAPIGVSDDGRLIAFSSEAPDLVANDTNGLRDVFVRDLLLGTNILISVDTNGMSPRAGYSTLPAISADGRYVAFCSTADSLVTGDTNNCLDVFFRDRQTGLTKLVSVAPDGLTPGSDISQLWSMSADGRYVLFVSRATNLTANAFAANSDSLFWRDMQSGETTAITTNGFIVAAEMSRDGQVVVFYQSAGLVNFHVFEWTPNSVTLITNFEGAYPVLTFALSPDGRRMSFDNLETIYIRDLVAKTNVVVSQNPINGYTRINPQFSSDGRFLTYAVPFRNSPNDTNNFTDVYVFDFDSRTNELISRSFATGYAPNRKSDLPTISPDGHFVAYRSYAGNVVPGVTNTSGEIYLYDRTSGTTTIVGPSAISLGAANSRAQSPVFSGDSQNLVFRSWASDIVFFDFNQFADVFSWKLAATNAIPVFSGQMVYAPTSGKSPTLTWPVVSGKSYQVQFKNNLIDPVWQPLNGTVTVVGDRGYATDLAPSPDQRFYRILAY
jgi:Tol biopolymer transport system component